MKEGKVGCLNKIWRTFGWISKNVRRGGSAEQPNGILYWKGSLWREELAAIQRTPFAVYDLHSRLADPYFEGKFLVYLTVG